jgi:hypothetical protein
MFLFTLHGLRAFCNLIPADGETYRSATLGYRVKAKFRRREPKAHFEANPKSIAYDTQQRARH